MAAPYEPPVSPLIKGGRSRNPLALGRFRFIEPYRRQVTPRPARRSPMIKGFGRSPFGPRPGGVPGATTGDAPTSPGAAPEAPPPVPTPPTSSPTAPPPPPVAPRLREAPREPDPATVQYETLKRHIHTRLVD